MTNSQLERKIKHLKQEIIYYCKVYPNNKDKINCLKSKYRFYMKFEKNYKEFNDNKRKILFFDKL